MRLDVPERCRLLDRVGAERRRCAGEQRTDLLAGEDQIDRAARNPQPQRPHPVAAPQPAQFGDGRLIGRSFCASPMIRGRRLITPAAGVGSRTRATTRAVSASFAGAAASRRPAAAVSACSEGIAWGPCRGTMAEAYPLEGADHPAAEVCGRKAGELIIRTRDRLSARRNRRRNVRPGPSRFAAAHAARHRFRSESENYLDSTRGQRGACQVEAMSDFPAYNSQSTDTDGLAGHAERPGTLNGAFWGSSPRP